MSAKTKRKDKRDYAINPVIGITGGAAVGSLFGVAGTLVGAIVGVTGSLASNSIARYLDSNNTKSNKIKVHTPKKDVVR